MSDDQHKDKPAGQLSPIGKVEVATENYFRNRVAKLVADEKWERHRGAMEMISDESKRRWETLISVNNCALEYTKLLTDAFLYYVTLYQYAVLVTPGRDRLEVERDANSEAMLFVRRRFTSDEYIKTFLDNLAVAHNKSDELLKHFCQGLQGWEQRAYARRSDSAWKERLRQQLILQPHWEAVALIRAIQHPAASQAAATAVATTDIKNPTGRAQVKVVSERPLSLARAQTDYVTIPKSWPDIGIAFLSDERIEVLHRCRAKNLQL